jgi:lysophospholipase L1-like esterase
VNKRSLYAGIAVVGGVILARVVASAAASSGGMTAERPQIVPGQSRLVLIGDSLAVGLAIPLRALAAEDQVTFQSAATSGSRIDQWARDPRVDTLLASVRPTLVLVSLGTNDAYMMGPVNAAQQAAAEALLAKIRGAGADVVWIAPPTLPATSAGHARRDDILSMVHALVPAGARFASEKLVIPRAPDNLHPTAAGYAAWSGCLWRWLRKSPGQCAI